MGLGINKPPVMDHTKNPASTSPEPEAIGLHKGEKIIEHMEEIPIVEKHLDVKNDLRRKVVEQYPNLKDCYSLTSLFVDLLYFRLLQKKDKTVLIQATVNQIHVSIQLTMEEVKEYGFNKEN